MNVEYEMDNEFELVFVVGYQNFLRIRKGMLMVFDLKLWGLEGQF